MATLGDMKARIADEFAGRNDLLPQIENAIRSAILTHWGRRWGFCDAVIGQVWPTTVESLDLRGPNGERVLAIDGFRMLDGGPIPVDETLPSLLLEGDDFGPLLMEGTELFANAVGYWRALRHCSMDRIEGWRGMTHGGIPTDCAWFGDSLWVSPQPLRPYFARVQVALQPLAPATDADGGVWMNQAEDLIRHTAAADVLANVILNTNQASVRAGQAELARNRLANYRTPAAVGRVVASYI